MAIEGMIEKEERIISSLLTDLNYYREILKENKEFSERLGIDYTKISGLLIEDIQALIDRNILKKITLSDENKNPIVELFIKVYTPKKAKVITEIARRNQENLEKEIYYQNSHLKFWDQQKIPTPKILHRVYVPPKGDAPESIALLMEYWSGPSHDMDIMAINSEIQLREEKLEDPFLRKNLRNPVEKEIIELENTKEKIIASVLETINMFHKISKPEISTYIPPDPVKSYYIEKGLHYFEKAILWNFIASGDLKLEEAIPNIKDEKIQKQLEIFKTIYLKAIDPIISILSDERYWTYLHGDEYLHHFKYRKINNDIRSGVLDADHVMLGRPELSKAKLLNSYLLGLSYEKARKYFLESLGVTENNMQKEQVESLRAFNLISLYEMLCMLGRKAQDDLVNRNIDFMVTHVPYDSNYITFLGHRPSVVYLGPYGSTKSISKIKEMLAERLESMLKDDIHKTDGIYVSGVREIYEKLNNGVKPNEMSASKLYAMTT